MWCANCMQPVNGIIDHELCKLTVWEILSQEYTQKRKEFLKYYFFEPKGVTVEERKSLTRSVSI